MYIHISTIRSKQPQVPDKQYIFRRTWFKSTVPAYIYENDVTLRHAYIHVCVRVLPFGRAFGKHFFRGIWHCEACQSDKSHTNDCWRLLQVFHFGSFPLAIRCSSLLQTVSSVVKVVFKEKSKEGNRVADSTAKHQPRNV